MPHLEKPEDPKDLTGQVIPSADKGEKIQENPGDSEKKCPFCNGAKTYGTPQECPECGGTGKFSVYARKNF